MDDILIPKLNNVYSASVTAKSFKILLNRNWHDMTHKHVEIQYIYIFFGFFLISFAKIS